MRCLVCREGMDPIPKGMCSLHQVSVELLHAVEALLATEDDPSDSCHWCGDLLAEREHCTNPHCAGVKAKAALARAEEVA